VRAAKQFLPHVGAFDNPKLHVLYEDGIKFVENVTQPYDVIIIDGLFRYEMIEIALTLMKDDGMIICDNAEGYGFYEGFKKSGLNRVDFFGNAPGVVLPHATSIFFKSSSFTFSSTHPIPVLAKE
ncbi:MAG: hypothetical protein WD000_03135, partial [Thermodesulfobacteriota bacterium]